MSALICVAMAIHAGSAFAWLVAEQNPLDLGVIQEDVDEASAVFVLRNTSSSETITINSLKTSCGCSEATVDSMTIPPGGTTTLTVALDLSKVKAGPFQKSAFVFYGEDETADPLELKFMGSAVPRKFYITEAIKFGALRREHIEPKRVVLDRFLKGARLLDVVVGDPILRVQPMRDPETGKSIAMIAFKRDELSYGKYSTYLILNTNDPTYPRVKVPVTVTLLQPQLFHPENLFIKAEEGQSLLPKQLEILLEDTDVIDDIKVAGLPKEIEHIIASDVSLKPTHIEFRSSGKITRNIVGLLTITCTLNGKPRTTRIPYYVRRVR